MTEYELASAGYHSGPHQRSPMPSPHLHFRRRSSFGVPVPSPSVAGPSGKESAANGSAAEPRTTKTSHVRSSSHQSHFTAPSTPTTTAAAAPRTDLRARLRAWLTALPFRHMSNPLLFGLRARLLFPDPLVYHLFIAIDLILRFTWSLKLSSHLHTISEIESGVFLMEALELLRRWMWVFLRVEWEVVKKMEGQQVQARRSPNAMGEKESAQEE